MENFKSTVQELEFIAQIKLTFFVNVSEGTRVCPLVARLNPGWRCKEWTEERTEQYDFYGLEEMEKNCDNVWNHYKIVLDCTGEYLTRIRGQHNDDYITKIELCTNFGKEYSIGHESSNNFDLDVPYGARVIGLFGSYNANLLSLSAYYD